MTDAREWYKSVKPIYENSIVFVRVGDKYQTYDNDAHTVAAILDIEIYSTVDSEFKPNGHYTFFSVSRAETMIKKLTAHKHNVAFIDEAPAEQGEAQAPANRPHENEEKDEKVKTKIGSFGYNENGICIKGERVCVLVDNHGVHAVGTIAQTRKGWSYGLMYEQALPHSHSGYSHGISIDEQEAYETEEEAVAAACLHAIRIVEKEWCAAPASARKIYDAITKKMKIQIGNRKPVPISEQKAKEPKPEPQLQLSLL